MFRCIASLLAIVALCGAAGPAFAADEKPKLNFAQDGDDFVASTTITVNNSSHVVWTHVGGVVNREVRLYYYVFQNRDLLVRGQKQIEVKWRLTGQKPADAEYHVEKAFLPNSAEMKALLPQLQKLMEEGESFRPKPTP
jgi:hypothetical protein